MKKRTGKWQRAILAELHKRPMFYVKELLPAGYTRSDYVAILRAATLLDDRGLIGVTRYFAWGGVHARVMIHHIGVKPDRLAYNEQYVDKITELQPCQHIQMERPES